MRTPGDLRDAQAKADNSYCFFVVCFLVFFLPVARVALCTFFLAFAQPVTLSGWTGGSPRRSAR